MAARPGGYPFRAPHFCDLALSHTRDKGPVVTSLDERLQVLAEAVVERVVSTVVAPRVSPSQDGPIVHEAVGSAA